MLARARADMSNPLLVSAYSLGVNAMVTAALGLAFWISAARIYPSPSVGRDSALIATMMQLSMIAQLNMANALVRFLPGHHAAARFLVAGYGASSAAAVVLGTAFILAAPHVSDDFAFLTREPLIGIGYVTAVALWGIFALQGSALVALQRAPWVPIANGMYGMLKLVALPVLFAVGSGHGVFVAWVVPIPLLLLPLNWLIFRRIRVRVRNATGAGFSTHVFGRRRLATFLAFDYVATIFAQASLAILPLLVVAVLGSRANAHFYIPFSIAIALDATFFSVSTSLVAEGSHAPARIPALVRLLVRRGALFVVPLILFLIVAAPLVMRLFGQEYVRASTSVLRILVCASLFRAVVALVGAIWRLEGSSGRIAVLDGCMLLGVIVSTVPLAHAFGVLGVALAWLISTAAAGCAGLPALIRYFRAGADGAPTPLVAEHAPAPRSGPGPL
jgi:O-antigen/teichoic acid export membrane protein